MSRIIVAGVLTLFAANALAADKPAQLDRAVPESTTIWTSGADGYHSYRIPSLIVTKAGTLLAFCEGRVNSRADSGKIHLLVRRSTDGGKTWSPQQVIWSDGDNTCGNPCPVVDQQTGTIWLPMSHNLGSDNEQQIAARTSTKSRTCWITSSSDDGLTWAKPVEITADVKKPEWTWYATGPGVGIQLEHGKHRGRLMIPCCHNGESHVIYSDDHGKSWQLGGSVPSPGTSSVPSPRTNECQMVELTDGRLMLNCRNGRTPSNKEAVGKHRQVSLSDDGGSTWSAGNADLSLQEPVCQASLIRCFPSTDTDRAWLLFSNPADEHKKRFRLTVRLSKDDGETWPHAKEIYPDSAAYSCLAMLPNGKVACLYECDTYGRIELATFSLDWLMTE